MYPTGQEGFCMRSKVGVEELDTDDDEQIVDRVAAIDIAKASGDGVYACPACHDPEATSDEGLGSGIDYELGPGSC
jgi:hypothetical protein